MKIAELVARRRFELREGPVAEPGPGEVQVRVEAVGICGSDLHYYSEGAVGDTPCVFPMVLGHEPAGVVVKAGEGVTGWSAGDRVFCEPAVYCYHCEFCRTGHHNVCANIRFMSMPGDPGYFREFVNVPEGNLMAIPEGMSFPQATLVEPLAVALHSMKFAEIRPGETAVVFGAGPIGLLTVACLRLAGAGRVWSVDPVGLLMRESEGRGVDVAMDCAAKGGSINQAIHAARNAGRVVLTGIPTEPQMALDMSPMRRKEIAFFNVRRSNHESEAALELLEWHPERFAPVVTHARPLEEIGAAFDLLERYADGVGKIVITR